MRTSDRIMEHVSPAGIAAGLDRWSLPRNFQFTNALTTPPFGIFFWQGLQFFNAPMKRKQLLTCAFHHQFAVHASSMRRLLQASSVKNWAGLNTILSKLSLNDGLLISSWIHSSRLRHHRSNSSPILSPSSPWWSPDTFTISQTQSGPVGS